MNKPSQFVFLPTEKASEIFLHKGGDMCFNKTGVRDKNEFSIPQHIYILSDDEIKEGDWVFDLVCKTLWKAKNQQSNTKGFKKIIASTNPELLKEKRIDEGFVEISSVAKIPQSDIEYIIGVYNRRGKIDVEKLAFDYAYQYNDCEVQRMDDRQGGFEEGYNQCLQDNADKKFTLEDMFAFCDWCQVNGYKACPSYSVNSERWMNGENIFTKKEIISSFMARFQKEQPKSDTVMVQYESNIDLDEPYDEQYGNTLVYQPKLKDGNIVIAR